MSHQYRIKVDIDIEIYYQLRSYNNSCFERQKFFLIYRNYYMLKNSANFSIDELKVIFGESKLLNFSENFIGNGVSTDSRTLEPNNIFLALIGENFDGHSKVAEAFSKGASCCVVNKKFYEETDLKHMPMLVVNDTIEALGQLAKYHRLRFEIPIVAICGSNGKTSTKEMLADLLEKKYRVLKTYQNFNNQIGVPLMLLQLSDEYEIAVLELGTNYPGEISILSEIAMPNYALITNIGKEHLEELLDLDGVELEETSVFSKIRGRGVAFINDDDERLRRYTMIMDKHIRFGTGDGIEITGKISLNELLNPSIEIIHSQGNFVANLQTYGYASALNAIAAVAVAKYFDVEDDLLKDALEQFVPLKGMGYARMFVERIAEKIVINDCYNANPSSMSMALNSLKQINSENQKFAVLGDMRELGEASAEEHISILKEAISCANTILITGDEFNIAYKSIENNQNVHFCETKNEIVNYLNNNCRSNDIILVKGSRGMKMEEVIGGLK